jgi:hypothetical protein
VSTYTKPIPTRKMQRFDRRRIGDVPMPQLYREVCEGYNYFLAKRMKAQTLGISIREVNRPKLKTKGSK